MPFPFKLPNKEEKEAEQKKRVSRATFLHAG